MVSERRKPHVWTGDDIKIFLRFTLKKNARISTGKLATANMLTMHSLCGDVGVEEISCTTIERLKHNCPPNLMQFGMNGVKISFITSSQLCGTFHFFFLFFSSDVSHKPTSSWLLGGPGFAFFACEHFDISALIDVILLLCKHSVCVCGVTDSNGC